MFLDLHWKQLRLPSEAARGGGNPTFNALVLLTSNPCIIFIMICNASNWLKKSSYGRVGGKENFFHCDRCDMCLGIQLKDSHKVSLLWRSVKPLPSNTSMQFLLTVLYTFSMVLRVRICWTIKLHVELLEFAIISFILMAVMFDSVDWYSCEKWDAYKNNINTNNNNNNFIYMALVFSAQGTLQSYKIIHHW